MRLQGMGRDDLDRVPREEVDRLRCLLLTQSVGEIRGGYTCLTRLMGTIEMIPETRTGVEGTVITVTVAAQSRQEKKRQREQRYRQAKGSDYVILIQEEHAKRLQTAALLGMGRNDLDRVPREEVERLRCLLLTQSVGEIRGGYTCLT